MNLIVNCSDIRATGATQVSISFINECLKFSEHNYFIFISNTISRQIEKETYPSNFKFYDFEIKPFYFGRGLKSWLRLVRLEKMIKPDCVFSIFGPSIWKPNSPHLMGFAYPYYIYSDSPFFNSIGRKAILKIWLHKIFHKYYLERNGNHYVCETSDVARRLPLYIKCDPSNVFTVTNSANHFFINYQSRNFLILPKKSQFEFRFVTLSSFSAHKNLKILNQVVPILKDKCPNINFRFVLTVEHSLFEERFNDSIKENLINLGRINASDCPQIYEESDALFLPTLMECFSASYAEAMLMGKPIVTSDLPFARVVCEEAAIYFDPMNPFDIALKIVELALNKNLQIEMSRLGKQRIECFDSSELRAEKYIEICRKLIQPK